MTYTCYAETDRTTQRLGPTGEAVVYMRWSGAHSSCYNGETGARFYYLAAYGYCRRTMW